MSGEWEASGGEGEGSTGVPMGLVHTGARFTNHRYILDKTTKQVMKITQLFLSAYSLNANQIIASDFSNLNPN